MSRSYTLVVERLTSPAIVVHGGAGSYLRTTSLQQRSARGHHLLSVATRALEEESARRAVLSAVEAMELDPRYNAGLGSKLQQDGEIRVSAAVMNGRETRLSSVYNVRGALHPSRLADALQERGDRNLDDTGAQLLMRELGIESQDLRTERTLGRWRELVASGDTADAEGAIADAGSSELAAARAAALPVPDDLDALRLETEKYGTVGAVALDESGALWACTSTGGRGHETPGRVSDSPTPSGNYACPRVAISATGFGEQILDLNICGRISTRMLDGASLEDALRRTFDEVAEAGGLLGVICIDREGFVGYAHTTEACGVAWASASGARHIDRHGRG